MINSGLAVAKMADTLWHWQIGTAISMADGLRNALLHAPPIKTAWRSIAIHPLQPEVSPIHGQPAATGMKMK